MIFLLLEDLIVFLFRRSFCLFSLKHKIFEDFPPIIVKVSLTFFSLTSFSFFQNRIFWIEEVFFFKEDTNLSSSLIKTRLSPFSLKLKRPNSYHRRHKFALTKQNGSVLSYRRPEGLPSHRRPEVLLFSLTANPICCTFIEYQMMSSYQRPSSQRHLSLR